MTAEQFVIWLKGFAQAANEYNVTPKQWQDVKDKLESVEDYYNFEEEENYDYATVDHSKWNTSFSQSGSSDINFYNHT